MTMKNITFAGLLIASLAMPTPSLAKQDPETLAQEASSGADARTEAL